MTIGAAVAENYIRSVAPESLISQADADAVMVNILHEAIQQARARGDETARRCAGKNLTETLLNVTEWFDVAGDDVAGEFL